MSQWSKEEELLSEHIHLRAPWELKLPFAGLAFAFVVAVMCVFGTSRSGKGTSSLLPTSSGSFGTKAHGQLV